MGIWSLWLVGWFHGTDTNPASPCRIPSRLSLVSLPKRSTIGAVSTPTERDDAEPAEPAAPPDLSGTADDRFARFVVPELDLLYRVGRSITGNGTDAEDLVQDTMLRAYRSIERFDGRYPRAWLMTIMRNAQINRVRRKRPELMRDPDVTMAITADTSEGGHEVEDSVMFNELDERIETSLNDLTPKFRTVIELVDMNGLAYQEAADVLGIPVGTVMSRLHRGRRKVRADLEKSGMRLKSSASEEGEA